MNGFLAIGAAVYVIAATVLIAWVKAQAEANRRCDADQEREAWDSIYEKPPTYRRVFGQPDTPFDLNRGQR